jgi:hypothetical protein
MQGVGPAAGQRTTGGGGAIGPCGAGVSLAVSAKLTAKANRSVVKKLRFTEVLL